MSSALAEVARLVHAESGILLKESQYRALEAAVARMSGDPETFLHSAADPLGGARAVARLIDEVTVGETFFLRDRPQLEAIDWTAALERAGDRPIRVWSAGCSTGEEPYSLALLATEALGTAAPVRILATDISRQALEGARRGVYRPRAVREVEHRLRSRYFHRDGGAYVVEPVLRERIDFACHNLVLDPIPPLGEAQFDVVLCRNVLIYFDAETSTRVIGTLEQALAPGGTLVLGAADALCRTTPRLAKIAGLPVPAPAPGRRRRRTKPRTRRRGAPTEPARAGRKEQSIALPDAHVLFERGLLALEDGDAPEAIEALRRALYVDPGFGLAAFQLARVYEAVGDRGAARRAYEQALRTLDADDEEYESILGQVDVGDVAAACRTRLEALR